MHIEKLNQLGRREMVSGRVRMDAVAIEPGASVVRLLESRIGVEARDRVLLAQRHERRLRFQDVFPRLSVGSSVSWGSNGKMMMARRARRGFSSWTISRRCPS